jgi:hypothetical protein
VGTLRPAGTTNQRANDDPALSPSAGDASADLEAIRKAPQLPEEKQLVLKSDTIAGAMIIVVPPSTNNAAKEHYPETKQTRKGK